jgi:hypothetical protein
LKEGDWVEDLGLYGRMIKMNGKGRGWNGVDWINLVLDRDKGARSCEHCKLKLISLKYGELLD